jgi:hypothetical protein
MRTNVGVQHTKPLLFPRPLYGSKLFRNLLFQVHLCLAITIIRTGMTFATIGFYSGRHWPKLGGKLKKNEKENKVKLWT